MDPVTIGAVLLAIAGGASGQLGSQLWAAVSGLVHRPLGRRFSTDQAPDRAAASLSGVAELAAFEEAKTDEGRAVALAQVLVARADADTEFRQALEGWWERASPIRAGEGAV